MPNVDPFRVNPTEAFDSLVTYWYATLCRATYTGPELVEQVAELAGMTVSAHALPVPTTILYLPVPDAFLLRTAPGAGENLPSVLAVRGTAAPAEWLAHVTNVGPVPTAHWQGRVSFYFQFCALSIWDRLEGLLPAAGSGVPWRVTGHSLGGAIAALLVQRGANDGRAPQACFCFGSPRSGDPAYAESQINGRRLRVTNHGDPVPTLPPPRLSIVPAIADEILGVPTYMLPFLQPDVALRSFRWKHWGTRAHLLPDGGLLRPPGQDDGEGIVDAAGKVAAAALGNFPEFIDHHASGEYARRIRSRIPIEFPAIVDDPDFPRIVELDQLNAQMNGGEFGAIDPILGAKGQAWEPGGGPGLPGTAPVFRFDVCGQVPTSEQPPPGGPMIVSINGETGEAQVLQASTGFGPTALAISSINDTHTFTLQWRAPNLLGDDDGTALSGAAPDWLIAPTTADRTLTLSHVSIFAGKEVRLTRTSPANGFKASLAPGGAELINGVNAPVELWLQGEYVHVKSDGTNWWIIDDGRIAPGVNAVRAAAQSIGNAGGGTILQWDTAISDRFLMLGPSGQLTAPRAGVYQLEASYAIVALLQSGQSIWVGYDHNAGAVIWLANVYSSGSNKTAIAAAAREIVCAAGDVIRVYAWQDTGSSRNTDTTLTYRPSCSLRWLRPLA